MALVLGSVGTAVGPAWAVTVAASMHRAVRHTPPHRNRALVSDWALRHTVALL